MKQNIQTDQAPQAIGAYSQAIQAGNTFYFSGQIPLDPKTMIMVNGIHSQISRVFENIKAVAEAAGGSLDHIVKLTIYLMDIQSLPMVNEAMGKFFKEPYPARTSLAVAALPRGALIEIDAVMQL